MDKNLFKALGETMTKMFDVKQSDAIKKAIEELSIPAAERIAKRKKDIESDKKLINSLDKFLQDPEKDLYDIKGIEEALNSIILTSNFEFEDAFKTIDEKIELIKKRTEKAIQLKELLIMMDEKDIFREE